MDKICLPRIPVRACHGVYETEQKYPQDFLISLEMEMDLRPAGTSDDLALTLDYGVLFERVKSFAEQNHFQLIEALAEHIAALILEDGRVDQVLVRVEKCAAKTEHCCFPAVVQITRRRV